MGLPSGSSVSSSPLDPLLRSPRRGSGIDPLHGDRPALSTLRGLLAPLGLDLQIVSRGADWDLLAAHGLPLGSSAPIAIRPDGATLVRQVRLAAIELARHEHVDDRERKREALQALLLAVRSHFPTFDRQRLGRSPALDELRRARVTPRMVKVARIAIGDLAEYL